MLSHSRYFPLHLLLYILSFTCCTVLDIVLLFHTTRGPPSQLSKMGEVKKKEGHIYVRSTKFLNFAPTMNRVEEYFAILEALKFLFRDFLQHSK